MLRHFVPPAIRAPFARYSHAVEIPAGARLLLVSGQLGITPDDAIPDGVEEQAALCFAAIEACLTEAGMGRADIVRLNAYVTDRAYLAGYMAARDRFIAAPPPASTLMIVSGFARPEFKVEIEALAARQD
ncbi:RidA family protein [Ancylobacter polymorphus]|uniref:RidA family protein n=1 Tax=Ancylobacter polymorphus TaxID=223390 RepID=A0A9E7CV94_9HYPH|nr:RidA family protein [Ancylobacter polymorphus]UOK69189.1 RidA family protein [Ancylobacter polymorphus]